jgi:hypothetical protein
VNGSTVLLSWDAPSYGGQVDTYVIEVGSDPGAGNVATVDTGRSLTTFLANAVPAGIYFVRVRARNPFGSSPNSNELIVVVGETPGPPTGLVATVSGSTALLTWNAPSYGGQVNTYVIEAGTTPGAANVAAIDTGGPLARFSAVAVPAGTYFVRVRARNSQATGAASNEVRLVVGETLGPPVNLGATVAGSTVLLTWNPPSSGGAATAYVIEAGTSTGTANIGVIDTGNPATTFSATAVPAGVYFVRVRARNGLRVGDASNEVVVRVAAPPAGR